jgi:pyrophosphatase PpaX
LTLHEPSRRANGQISCILFDLDGTLIDTTDLIYRSYQHALTSVLGESMTRDELYIGYGQPLPEAFAAILAHRNVRLPDHERSDLIDRLIVTYRAFNVAHHDALTREFPGVRSTLAELQRRGFALGLVTSKARGIGERGLRLIGLDDRFDTTVFMEDSERHKPHPDPVWVALHRLGYREQPSRALFVGDSTHDVQAGRAAGTRTAGALWGPFPPEALAAEGPDYLLESVEDLLDLCAP